MVRNNRITPSLADISALAENAVIVKRDTEKICVSFLLSCIDVYIQFDVTFLCYIILISGNLTVYFTLTLKLVDLPLPSAALMVIVAVPFLVPV